MSERFPGTCGTCKYWEQHTLVLGKCYRYPPQIGDSVMLMDQGTIKHREYVDTYDYDWCGEYKSKE